jgi:PAS domain S-box-containing protein
MSMPSTAPARTRPPKRRTPDLSPLLESMLDTMPAFAVLVRDDGTIAFANDPLARLLGWTQQAAQGRRLEDLLSSDEATRLLATSDVVRLRTPLQSAAGPTFMVDWTARRLASESGDGFLCLTGSNATREVELENFIIQNQWFETAAALSGGLAHDFNNVLAAILGLSEIMSLRLPPDHALQEFARKIGVSIERAKILVRRFSQFSRKNAGGAEPQATTQVFEEFSKLLRSFLPGSVTLSIELAPTTPWFEADRYVIEQIIVNCANFLRARLRADTGEMKLSSYAAADGKHAVVELRGSGQGLLGVDVEAFFALDLRPTATAYESGTGLHVARVLATRQRAVLRVVRHDPRTVSFVLELPAA